QTHGDPAAYLSAGGRAGGVDGGARGACKGGARHRGPAARAGGPPAPPGPRPSSGAACYFLL
ncbi:hypothetical protein ACFWAG_42785, partial [Streptomyces violascens]